MRLTLNPDINDLLRVQDPGLLLAAMAATGIFVVLTSNRTERLRSRHALIAVALRYVFLGLVCYVVQAFSPAATPGPESGYKHVEMWALTWREILQSVVVGFISIGGTSVLLARGRWRAAGLCAGALLVALVGTIHYATPAEEARLMAKGMVGLLSLLAIFVVATLVVTRKPIVLLPPPTQSR